jgi:type IV pilus modification protein PilV
MNSTSTHERVDTAGFTLVEVLIAFVLLAIGMLAIGAAQLASLRVAAQSQYRSQALYLAEEQMERLLAMPGNDLMFRTNTTDEDTEPIDLTPGDEDMTSFRREWTITPNTPQPNLATLRVTVTWDIDGNGTQGAIQTVTLDGVKETTTAVPEVAPDGYEPPW